MTCAKRAVQFEVVHVVEKCGCHGEEHALEKGEEMVTPKNGRKNGTTKKFFALISAERECMYVSMYV
jgi:hypothetical protein